jgi:hypothetical protein
MLTDRYCGGSQMPYTERLRWRPRDLPQMPHRFALATTLSKAVLATMLVAAAFAGSAVRPAPAAAATPCWKLLLNDWYDGRIDQTYAVHCYRDALKHLPSDVQTYSSAHDDILRALQSAITKEKNAHKSVSNNTLVPPQGSGGGSGSGGSGSGSGGGSGGSGATTTNGSTTSTTQTTSTNGQPGRNGNGGLAGSVSSDDPSSIPTPLLILGGLALLLVAAGAAGLIAKRVQSRRSAP